MPPKPWETRARNQQHHNHSAAPSHTHLTGPAVNISHVIKSNGLEDETRAVDPNIHKPVPKPGDPTAALATAAAGTTAGTTTGIAGTTATTGNSLTTATTSPYSSYSSPYSSYGGGYGGYGGGFGSMYGGGMFGGGMYGGMYGMNQQNQPAFLMNSLNTLYSFGFLINTLGEIGKTLQSNIDGIHRFGESFKSKQASIFMAPQQLLNTLKNFSVDSAKSGANKIVKLIQLILQFVKKQIFMMGNEDRSKSMKIINLAVKALILVFVATFLVPLATSRGAASVSK